jgi:gamma-glutamylcyclotransferase (GGCT)/AIG2-like uncharacterized protein YtfP
MRHFDEDQVVPEKFAFYGSLRKGHGNYRWAVEPAIGMKFDGDIELGGYKMFDIGSKAYPFIVKTEDLTDTITVELYTIPDREKAVRIHAMELGAGYYAEEIWVDGQAYTIYAKHGDFEGRYKEVVGGDWTAYKTQSSVTI